MKLFRFELNAEPGSARSGMVFNGKIYETNGAEAVGVHEPADVRPLSPVPQPGALRIFRTGNQPIGEDAGPAFFYGNPAALVGASTMVNLPGHVYDLTFEPYLAAVLIAGGYDIPEDEADDHILGLTLMIALVDRGAMRVDGVYGRSHDLGIALGPVITTPDELDDHLADQEFGRRYRLNTAVRLNAVERGRGQLEELPWTVAQAVSAASRSCTLREADVIALGPIAEVPDDLRLGDGDEVALAVDNLGTLTVKLSQEV